MRLVPGRLVGATVGVFGAGVALGFMLGTSSRHGIEAGESANEREQDFRRWSISRLRDLAEHRNIPQSDTMSRQELVEALRGAAWRTARPAEA